MTSPQHPNILHIKLSGAYLVQHLSTYFCMCADSLYKFNMQQYACVQVRYLECIDIMVQQLVYRLHQAEVQGRGHFAICITGDHSTPVLFGDHSHEPVPFAIAHVRHVVSLLEQVSYGIRISCVPCCYDCLLQSYCKHI